MDRRTYIKTGFAATALGLLSFSSYKFFFDNKPILISELLEKENLLSELVETIIPMTDSPGAKMANVHKYIINVIINCKSAKEQHIFVNGLADLEEYANDQYKNSFVACSDVQKKEILTYFSIKSYYSNNFINKVRNKILGEPFFSQLKRLTVEGFCMSETGCNQALAYDYIPIHYNGCVPLKNNQRSWATK